MLCYSKDKNYLEKKKKFGDSWLHLKINTVFFESETLDS